MPVEPPIAAIDGALVLVTHLMIAGRLRWREPAKKSGMGPRLAILNHCM